VNAEERKRLKRATDSQVAWKNKAKDRQQRIRFLQIKIRDLELSRNNWKEKFFQTKTKEETQDSKETTSVSASQTKVEGKKN